MSTAEDILDGAKLRQKHETDPVGALPSRVYVLQQNGLILGVLSTEQRALDEAHDLMVALGGTWHEMTTNRYWSGGPFVYVQISAHDVR